MAEPGATGVSVGAVNSPGIYAASLCRVVADPRAGATRRMAQGTSGAVQINTDGFAFCSFMENVDMGTCQAGLLDRLQLLTDRSKRSSRGMCCRGKFRK